MLENSLDSSESGDNVDSVVVELPELSIMSLGCPPEGVVLEELVLLPIGSDSPSLEGRNGEGSACVRLIEGSNRSYVPYRKPTCVDPSGTGC